MTSAGAAASGEAERPVRPVLAIVDGFEADARGLRRRALAQPFRRPEGVNFPGLEAPPLGDPAPTMERFSKLLGGIELRWLGEQGMFRLTTSADAAGRTSLVHADTPDFTAVLHLSTARAEGTFFYRHRALGIERIDFDDPWLEFVRPTLVRDSTDLSAWEVTGAVPQRFNRLVIFDGKFFHSAARALTGGDRRSGRLTQNFFFSRA